MAPGWTASGRRLVRRSSAAAEGFGRFAWRGPAPVAKPGPNPCPKPDPKPGGGCMLRIIACAAPAQTAIIAAQACCVSGSVR
jgi:hypothetical protein